MVNPKQLKFIEEANKVHKGLYIYTLVEFKTKEHKVIIICRTHGNFLQTPKNHLNGQGCPVCGAAKSIAARTKSRDKFIADAKMVHGDTYIYSKVIYVNANTKVILGCAAHGDFLQKPANHLSGEGCPKCGKIRMGFIQTRTFDSFLAEARGVHGDTFEYERSWYVNMSTKTKIKCKVHGIFKQLPSDHLKGCGCSKCSDKVSALKRTLSFEEFKLKSELVHGDLYTYIEDETDGNTKDPRKIICPKHGEFSQTPNDHMDGHGCPTCGMASSKKEEELFNFVLQKFPDAVTRDRSGVAGYGKKLPLELDIFIPSIKLGIEVQGLYWHSNALQEKRGRDWVLNHQFTKHENCKTNGVELLTLFEDEIANNKQIVLDLIAAKTGSLENKIFARKLTAVDLTWKEAKDFLIEHHLQGACAPAKSKGLIDSHGELFAVMVFDLAKSTRHRAEEGCYEVIRYCSKGRVVGGSSKLLSAFLRSTDGVAKVISYADRRISQGKMYQAMGFELVHESRPDYMYVVKDRRHHKSNFTRAKLAKLLPNFDPGLTEEANCFNAGIYKIYNCGLQRWELEL